jgi:hypothetical protein
MSAGFSHFDCHPWLWLARSGRRARLVDRPAFVPPRIAEEMRSQPSQGANARHNDEGLSRRMGRGRDPQLSSTVGTQAVNAMPSPAMTSDDITGTLEIILAVGVVGELIVPWAVIGLSNWLSFDVPFWALGPIFAGPPTLALATALIVWLVYVRRLASRERGRVPTAANGHMMKQQETHRAVPRDI